MMAFLTSGPITVSDKETTVKHNINILLTVFAKATGPLHPLPSPLEQELPGGWSSLHRWGKSSHCGGSMASASCVPELPEGNLGAGTASWAPTAHVAADSLPQPGAASAREVPSSANPSLSP